MTQRCAVNSTYIATNTIHSPEKEKILEVSCHPSRVCACVRVRVRVGVRVGVCVWYICICGCANHSAHGFCMCSYVNVGLGDGLVLCWHVSHFVWQVWAIDKLLWSEALWSETLWSELSLPAERLLLKYVLFPSPSLVTHSVSRTHGHAHTHAHIIAFVACERSQYVSIELSVVPTVCPILPVWSPWHHLLYNDRLRLQTAWPAWSTTDAAYKHAWMNK